MRIAYILPDWPEPTIRGYQRIVVERIRRLVCRHEIEVFCFADDTTDACLSELTGICSKVHRVQRNRVYDALDAIAGVAIGEPAQVAYYRSARMRQIIAAELLDSRFDAVVVQLIRMARYVPANFSGIRLLDMVDPLSLSYARSVRWRPRWSRWIYRLEARRLASYEHRVADSFDRVLLLSRDELLEYSRTVSLTKLSVVPYAVDLGHFRLSASKRESGMIVLSGNLGYGPNVEAADLFCRTIFPLVKSAVPNARLWLVGTNPHPRVRRWDDGETIHVTGHVPDIRPFLQRAMVSVCPVTHRVGTQTKILEALAAATPVIAFSETAAGLLPDCAFPVQVAQTATDFADHVIRLLNDKNWAIISAQSRSYVDRRYSWDESTRQFESLLVADPI